MGNCGHTDPLIRLEGVTFRRGDKIIFNNVSLSIPRGKITAIMGPSGTGKTTLLQLIGGALRPESGHVYYDGLCVDELSERQLYVLREKMGMLFQHSALFTNLSVYDNVAFPIREHTQLPEFFIRYLVLMKLEAVGLRGAKDLFPSELSGGMARRVALARAMALDPELIMYDEPFTGQDPISMGVLVQLVKKFNDALNMTSIIVSHDVPETVSIADYIYIFSNGVIVGEGTPEALANNQNPHVLQFLKGLADGAVPFHYPASHYEQDLFQGKEEGVMH